MSTSSRRKLVNRVIGRREFYHPRRDKNEFPSIAVHALEVIAEAVDKIGNLYDVRKHLDRVERENDDRYHKAYARSAEQYLEISKKRLEHQEYVMTELLRRWNEHTAKLEARIAELQEEIRVLRESRPESGL